MNLLPTDLAETTQAHVIKLLEQSVTGWVREKELLHAREMGDW